MAACLGWGKSQQGPIWVGIAGNGSETLLGVWVQAKGAWGRSSGREEHFQPWCESTSMCE